MKNNIRLTNLTPLGILTLVGCGGGGGGGSTNSLIPSSNTFGGVVVKGPLDNAFVFVDYDNDGIHDSNEPSTYTDTAGAYSLTSTDADAPIVVITDETTTDTSSGTVLAGVRLSAPSNAQVISPMTTLVQEGGISASQVAQALGLPDGVDPITYNPYATGVDSSEALAVEKIAQQLMATVNAIAAAAEGAGANANEAFSSALASVVNVVSDKIVAASTLDFSDNADLSSIQSKAATEIASLSGVNIGIYANTVATAITAVKNVNDVIDSITNTDLSASSVKNAFSTSQVLKDQINEAATSNNPSAITFTNASEVADSASNAAPTDLRLSATAISENTSGDGLIIGTATPVDLDQPGDGVFVFATAGTDADAFTINASTGELRLNSAADFETKSSYSINILVTDEGGKTYTEAFEIAVTDANDAPTVASSIADQTVSEDTAFELQVSDSVFDDVDAGDNLTYQASLADGSNLPNWLTFDSGTRTFGGTPANGDVGTTEVKVTATDAAGASVSETFTITVTNTNDRPTNISLSSTSISESEGVTLSGLNSFYFIGDLSVSDPDNGDSVTYSIVAEDGTDHAAFFIDPETQKLGLRSQPNFENKSSYAVVIQATDSAGESVTKSFAVSVNDENEAPVINCCCEACAGSGVSSSSAEDSTFSYTFSASDPDTGDTVTLSAPIKPDWLSFDQSTGVLSGTPAQSDAGDHLVTLQATDNHGLSSSQVFTISVTLVNDTPHISVTNQTSIAENSNQAVAATFSVTDEDDDVVTLALTGNGEDDDLFEIVNGQLRIKASADYEAQSSYRVQVSATDSSGASTIKNIEVTVTDEAESVTGTIVDGYVAGATVFQDLDNDNVLDSDEPYTTTSATGAFTLDGVISSATAPLKMITGFDIGTNKAIVTSLGVPTTATGNVIASPLGTIATLAQADDSLTNISTVMDRVATYFGVSDSSQSNIDLINDDPIAGMKSENASVVSASQDAFHANQYVMALAHVAETFGEYISGIVDTAIQNNLSSNGVSDVAALAGGASSDYAKVGADAFFSQASAKIANTGSSNAITDSDDLQAYVFDTKVFEGDTTPTAVVHLNHAFAEDITLNYALSTRTSDTASAGSDFTATTGTVTILAGFTTATINLPLLADTAIEITETFTLTLSNPSAGSIQAAEAEISIYDSSKTIDSDGELAGLSQLVSDQVASDVTASLVTEYNAYASDNGASWFVGNEVASDAAASVLPSLRVIADVLYSEIKTQIDAAAAFTDINEFAEELMITNAAVKLFDPSDFIGTHINGDGTYPSGQSLTTLTSAVQAAYAQDILDAADTNGDVFGTDTSANFANATVSILTDGNDTETLTSASEIVATYDGTDTVNAGGGNDKVIGGSGVDTFDGEAGNDHLYGYAGNDILTGGSGNDDLYGGLGNDTLAGGAGDDYILGAAGDDIITTGIGTDEVLGGLGNDTVAIDGSGNKTIDGGTGSNTLTINHSGIIDLSGFTIGSVSRSDGADWTLTADNGDVVTFKNIIDYTYTSGAAGYWDGYLTVNSNTYRFVSDMRSDSSPFSGAYGSVQAFVYEDNSNVTVVLPESGKWLPQYRMSNYKGFSLSGNESFALYGSSGSEVIFGGYQVDNIQAGDGNDFIFGGDGADNIDAGAGDDVVYTSLAGLTEDTAIIGGTGSNTLAFNKPGEAGGWDNDSYGSVTFNLATDLGNATNFHNIVGSNSDDTLTGDNSANVIIGGSGSDTLVGGAGDDQIYGDYHTSDTSGNTYGYRQYGVSEGIDNLYGGTGDDVLVGNNGDDLLDGGAGADIITSGGGSDTIILAANTGGATLGQADVITDFADGSDVFGLDGGLQYSELSIIQNGSDTVISIAASSEYLATLRNISADNIDYTDFVSTATGSQTLDGTSGDDVILGASGADIITTSTGNDVVLAYGGNDTITIDGSGNKTIDGGTGSNTLTINHSGIIDLSGFTIGSVSRSDGADWTLTADNGDVVTFKNIIDYTYTSGAAGYWDGYLTVNSNTYRFVSDMRSDSSPFSGAYGSVQAFVYEDNSNVTVVLPESGKWLPQYRMSNYKGFSLSGNESFALYGSSGSEVIFGGYQVDNIQAGDGNDFIFGGDGADNIDAGAGDDVVYTSLAGLTEDTAIIGGTGSNTLAFNKPGEAGGWDNDSYGSVTFNLATDLGNATNFHNIVGSNSDDTLTGDNSANVIIGGSGSDTLVGGAGDDQIYGDYHTSDTSGNTYGYRQYGVSEGIDNLYGGTGDDVLVGNNGDDLLDGGAGADIITSGGGSDTIILAANTGGATLGQADVITDFADGSDVFGLDGGLQYSELSIIQNGSDTVISIAASSEYLATLRNISADNIDYTDFVSTATGSQTLDGTSGDDVILGASGADIITTSTGNDVVLAYGGNDTITIDGSGNKTIDGGTGSNTLTINHSGIIDLSGFTIGSVSRSDGADWTLTADNGDVVTFKNIIDYTYTSGAAGYWDGYLTVNSNTYRFVSDMRSDSSPFSGAYGSVQAFVYEDNSNVTVVLPESGKWLPQYRMSNYKGFSLSGNESFALYGSSGSEVIFGGYQVDNIQAGDGNDFIFGGDGADNIDAGAGDDVVYTSLAGLTEDTAIIGGTGSNTLAFNKPGEAGGWDNDSYGSVTFNLATDLGNATNFHNIVGSNSDDTLTGDNSANVIIGGSGSDTLVGGAGDDQIYGDYHTSDTSGNTYGYRQYGVSEGIDNLYGGTGDDVLVGNNGDDLLDGGAGADIITSGGGSDTIILAANTGGATLGQADVITDFADGSDVFGLDSNLTFSDLSITQGTGSYASHAIVRIGSSGEYLAVVENTAHTDLTIADFSAISISNYTPEVSSTPITSATEDSAYSYTLTASDLDGDAITFAAPTLPSWLTFNATTGVLSGTPTNDNVGDHSVVLIASDGDGATDAQAFTITVANVNDDPSITSTASTEVNEDSAYSYTFTASDIDADDLLTLSATTLPAWLSFNSTTGVLSGTPTNDNVGQHAVALTVSDTAGSSETQSFTITVANVNDAPAISSSAITSVTESQAYSYTFEANDVDIGDSVTLSATTKPAWLSFNEETGVLSGTPSNSHVGDHSVVLTATDSGGTVTTQAFTLTVANVNTAPTVSSTAITTVAEDEAYSYTFAASDVDAGDTITLSATTKPEWLSFDATTGVLSGTPNNNDVGEHSIVLTATDAAGETATQSFTIGVTNVNDTPTVTNAIPDQSVAEDSPISFQFASDVFSDVDANDDLTFEATLANGEELPSWLNFDAQTRTFAGTPTNGDVGDYELRVTATDSSSAAVSDNFIITVTNTNDAPTVANAISDRTTPEDSPFSFQIAENAFNDVDSEDSLTYAATLSNGNPLPSWLSFDTSTKTFSGTPNNDDVGSAEIKVTVTDESGAGISDTFTLTVTNTNDAPVITSTAKTKSTEGFEYAYTIEANDVDEGDVITLAATTKPDWMTFDSATGVLSGTPMNEHVGDHSVALTATDVSGAVDTQTFTVSVSNTNSAPTISSTAITSVNEDSAYSYTFEATDADVGDTFTLSAQTLPSWLTFNSSTGVLSGTPTNTHVGNHSVVLTATDTNSAVSTQSFTITVSNTNDAPTVSSTALTAVDEDTLYSYTFEAEDVDVGDSLTLAATTKPDWLSFNASTGVLSGTPANTNVGNHSIVLTATDGNGAVTTQSFTLTVTNTNDAPTVTSSAITTVDEDAAYSYTFLAADVDIGDNVSLSATTKPDWLEFDTSTGVLSGTPTNSNVGNHSVVLTATDDSGEEVSQSFTITVANTNDAPVLSVSNGSLTEDSGTYTVSGTLVGSDVDANTTLTYSTNTTTGSYGTFTLNTSTGAYSYTLDNGNTEVQGLNGSETLLETFTVSVSDGLATTSETLSFTINGTNDSPTGLILSANSVVENNTGATIGTLSASDLDDDTLTYSLASGGDNSSFEIVGTTLKLKDSIAANYEADNVYDITINVTDGVATQTITEEIWVTNVDESNTAYYNNKVDTNASATLNAQNDPAVEQLMSGRFWGEAGNGIDLTFSFMDTNSLFSSHYNYSGAQLQRDTVEDPSNVFKNTVREILELFESITLINFTETEETGNTTGHLRFGTSSAETSAFAWFPYSGWDAAGDVWLSDTNNYYNNASALMDGTYWHQTIIHEIGHAVGLAHPHQATTYGDRTYGTNSSQGSKNNANPYSTMAYPEYVGESLDSAENFLSRPTTLMMDDIAALQHLYGVNEQYNDDDNIYRINSLDNGTYNAEFGDQNIYGTIWDAGGEDTFTWYDQNTVALIDLNDGEFSCFGDISGPDDTDLDNTWLNDGSGILGIAHNVIIENAIGGTNTDTILGNEADNMLYGGAGAGVQDRLTGGAGADTFVVSVSDAATNLGAADIITDFDVGTDKIGLEDATVTDLGWADASGGTQIYDVDSSQVLVFLESVSASALDEDDFVQTDFV